MIGAKKLSEIRADLKAALGDDPIRWLEEQMSSPRRTAKGDEVLRSLRRFLEAGQKPKRRTRRAKAR